MFAIYTRAADVFQGHIRKTVKKIGSVLVLSVMVLLPSTAVADVNFGIGFNLGTGPAFSGKSGKRKINVNPRRYNCLSPREARGELRDRGYRYFHNASLRGKFIRVRAVRNGWVRRVVFDRCTGKIIRANKVRKWRNIYRRNGYDGITFRLWLG